MKRLEDHIAPGEAVLWRSPTMRDWAKDHAMALVWAAGAPALIGLISSGRGGLSGLAVGLVFVLGLAGRQLAARPAEALLTGRQLLFRRGIRRPEIRTFERRDIARLEIFGGDGTVVLHGRREELYRPALLGDPLALARALDVPTTFWKPYEPTSRLWKLDLYLKTVMLLLIMGLASVLVFALPETFWEGVRGAVSEMPGIVAIASALGIITAAGIPSGLAVAALFGGLRRLLYPREELNRMRCYRFNPLWRGRDPATVAASGSWVTIRAARLAFDRAMYGPFPDCASIEPEHYEPGAFPPPDAEEEG